MSKQKIKANITISRPSGFDNEIIRIAIGDESSRVQFVTLDIALADFAEALTGLASVKCDAEVKDLDVVGLEKERKQETIIISITELESANIDYHNRAALTNYLSNTPKFQQHGWELEKYLGSQGQVTLVDNKNVRIIAYYIRYV